MASAIHNRQTSSISRSDPQSPAHDPRYRLYLVMKPGCILASALLCGAFALPSFSKDWLFVTTNWKKGGNERVLLIDPESGQIRTLWNRGRKLDAVVSPDAGRLYVTFVGDEGYELAVVETATGAVLH